MTQSRELPPDASPVDLIGKKLLQEFPHIVAPRGQEHTLSLLQEFGELANIGGIGADRERSQPLLDAQVIEKTGEQARVCFRSHREKCRNIVCALSDTQESNEGDAEEAAYDGTGKKWIMAPSRRSLPAATRLRTTRPGRLFMFEVGKDIAPFRHVLPDAFDHRAPLFP